MVEFNCGYYQTLSDASAASARVVVPYLMALFGPTSVIDVGCGWATGWTLRRAWR